MVEAMKTYAPILLFLGKIDSVFTGAYTYAGTAGGQRMDTRTFQ